MNTTTPTQETDTTQEKAVSIEMVSTTPTEPPKEVDEVPYKEGDMFG